MGKIARHRYRRGGVREQALLALLPGLVASADFFEAAAHLDEDLLNESEGSIGFIESRARTRAAVQIAVFGMPFTPVFPGIFLSPREQKTLPFFS